MGYDNFEELLAGANAMDLQNHRFDANDPVV
jgi:hypothetical protein